MFSLIITDYKTMKETMEYVAYCISKFDEEVHIIIVDNSSEECGLHYMQNNDINFDIEHFEGKKVYLFYYENYRIRLIDAENNGGYSAGNNLGAKYSRDILGDQFYIFSNNDLKFSKQINLRSFELIFENDQKIGIIGPNIISPNGKRQNPRKKKGVWTQMIFSPFNLMWFGCRFNKWLWNLGENKNGKAEWVSGSFMIVNSNAFWKAKGFDENIFLYAEEIILSERMRRIGYYTYYDSNQTILHYHRGASSDYKSRKMNHESLRYYYREYKGTSEMLLVFSDICFEFAEVVYKYRVKLRKKVK